MAYNNKVATAPNTQTVGEEWAEVPRSPFNLSFAEYLQANYGNIIPFWSEIVLPKSNTTIVHDVVINTRVPLNRRLENNITAYVHTFALPLRHCWKGWKNFIDRGNTGKVVKTIPQYNAKIKKAKENGGGEAWTTNTVFSPLDYLGYPVTAVDKSKTNVNEWSLPVKTDDTNDGVTHTKPENVEIINNFDVEYNENDKRHSQTMIAFKLFMYNKIYRDFFAPKELLYGNKNWFPDNDEDFILPYEEGDYVNTSMGKQIESEYEDLITNADLSNKAHIPEGYGENPDQTPAYLNVMHYRQWNGDYFTTGSIFPDLIRGESETIDLSQAEVDASDFLDDVYPPTEADIANMPSNVLYRTWATMGTFADNNGSGTPYYKLMTPTFMKLKGEENIFEPGEAWEMSETATEKYKELVREQVEKIKLKVKASLTLNNLRRMIVMNTLRERLGKVEGSYNELIGSQFGHDPNSEESKPKYVGGGKISLVFNKIDQTSASTEDSPLGSYASQGNGTGEMYIGNYFADDYTVLMSVLEIIPDTYYAQQGIDRSWSNKTWEDQYLPLFNNLGNDYIKNEELFIDEDVDKCEEPFAYKERFTELKQRRNQLRGLANLGSLSLWDSSNFIKRMFAETPTMSPKFLTICPDTLDLSPHASTNEPVFDVTIGNRIDYVAPMPYRSKPMDFGIRY